MNVMASQIINRWFLPSYKIAQANHIEKRQSYSFLSVCEQNSPVTDGQRASNAEHVTISCHHHAYLLIETRKCCDDIRKIIF